MESFFKYYSRGLNKSIIKSFGPYWICSRPDQDHHASPDGTQSMMLLF